jgi:hypothetical protein
MPAKAGTHASVLKSNGSGRYCDSSPHTLRLQQSTWNPACAGMTVLV